MNGRLLVVTACSGSLALTLLLGGPPTAQTQDAAAESRSARIGLGVGYRPPPFAATDLDGAPQTLTQYQGKVLVLHFWASWCPYCRNQIPDLTELSKPQWTSRGVAVLTISVDEDLPRLRQFVQQAKFPYPVIANVKNEPSVADQYGVSGIPVTYIVARDGRIAQRFSGAAELVEAVRQVLAQQSAPDPAT